MTEEVEEVKYQIYTEARGQYVILKGQKIYQVLFPHNATLEDNLEALGELTKAMQASLDKINEDKAKLVDGELKAEPAE